MKNLKSILLVLSLSFFYIAQGQLRSDYRPFVNEPEPYNHWSVEPSVGITKIRDITSFKPFNGELGIRYMANPKFGVRLKGSYTTLHHDQYLLVDPIEYYGGTLQGVLNVGRILDFEDFAPWYTILTSIGGTYTYSNPDTNQQIFHRLSNFHLSGTIDNEFRLARNVAFKVSLDVVTGVNERPFDPASTETTSIININMGLVIGFGNRYRQHADWIVEDESPIIIDKTLTIKPQLHKHYHTHLTKKTCECEIVEYVFFDHDSDVINRSGLNAIQKVIDGVKDKSKITITGWASPTVGQDDYNLQLSKRRAEAIKEKMVMVGINPDKIEVVYKGKDHDKQWVDVYDLGRRVEIILR